MSAYDDARRAAELARIADRSAKKYGTTDGLDSQALISIALSLSVLARKATPGSIFEEAAPEKLT